MPGTVMVSFPGNVYFGDSPLNYLDGLFCRDCATKNPPSRGGSAQPIRVDRAPIAQGRTSLSDRSSVGWMRSTTDTSQRPNPHGNDAACHNSMTTVIGFPRFKIKR
jgi:hypothetical protein